MHQDIMKWPSRQLYDDKLTADQSVASHLLAHLPGVEANENTSLPLLFVDTAGCFMYELPHEADESKGNEWEVGIVESHVDALIGSGVKQEDVGIITPYNLQVSFYPGIILHVLKLSATNLIRFDNYLKIVKRF